MRTSTILITGCSSGIGLYAARGLHARGHRVFASARRVTDVERLRAEGLEAVQLDVDDPDSVAAGVDEVLAHTGGRLDALFNNAGFGLTGAVEDVSREALRLQLETNLLGAHDLTCRVLPVMRRQGRGRIIQCSSVLGLVAFPFRGPYCASKFALEALSDCLRQELHGTGIHVVLIEPGPILSRFRANSLAAFRRHIDPEHSPHRERYRKTLRRLETEGAAVPFTLGPEAVLKKLVRALESPRPKPRYHVTVPTHLFAALRRLTTTRGLDRLVGRHL
ncbi:MAG: SDR family NAD(P)-dependent oxidoreductase [Candidatus Competibacterales bacterium]|nr:SDR family NAD(P)-dependent oxidoreductase [Candidatus Competibacterales bacterium]